MVFLCTFVTRSWVGRRQQVRACMAVLGNNTNSKTSKQTSEITKCIQARKYGDRTIEHELRKNVQIFN
jgi:hypothetical protein